MHDCTTIASRSQGAYTDGTFTPRETLNYPRDVYLTRIEFTSEYVTICDPTMNCTQICPYNGTEPDLVLERNNSVIKAFYGTSGSWVDSVYTLSPRDNRPATAIGVQVAASFEEEEQEDVSRISMAHDRQFFLSPLSTRRH